MMSHYTSTWIFEIDLSQRLLEFSNKWIGQGGSRFWPARILGILNFLPHDFLKWGGRNKRYNNQSQEQSQTLKLTLIHYMFEQIPNEFMRRAVEEDLKRLRKYTIFLMLRQDKILFQLIQLNATNLNKILRKCCVYCLVISF